MQVYTLEIEEDYSFDLIGISSHVFDYKLAWALNRHMDWMLLRKEDIEVTKGTTLSFHSLFEYKNESDIGLISLIGNLSETGPLLPEYQHLDFFLKLENLHHEVNNDFLKRLRKTPFVQMVMNINAEEVRSRHHLIYDINRKPDEHPSVDDLSTYIENEKDQNSSNHRPGQQ